MITERFYRRLHRLCERRIKELYVTRTGWDLKCPSCRTWASIGGMRHTSGNAKQERYECQHCYKETAWEFHGPAAVSVPIEYWPDMQEVKP